MSSFNFSPICWWRDSSCWTLLCHNPRHNTFSCYFLSVTFCVWDCCFEFLITSVFFPPHSLFFQGIFPILVSLSNHALSWVCGRSFAGIVGSNPTGGMDVCLLWVLCVFRGLCVWLITRPEESYRLWCVVECDRNLVNETLAHWRLSRPKQTIMPYSTVSSLASIKRPTRSQRIFLVYRVYTYIQDGSKVGIPYTIYCIPTFCPPCVCVCVCIYIYIYIYIYMQGVPGGMCQTSGGCSLC